MRINLIALFTFIFLLQWNNVNLFQLVPENKLFLREFEAYKRAPNDPKYASNPIVLVPGDGGSRLRANLTGKPSVVHYECFKTTSDFYDIWLSLSQLAVLAIDCWADNMKLLFNNKTMMSENNVGVDIKVPGFGETDTVEWLDSSKWSPGLYFATIADALVSWGYRRGKNLAGAPFDWRLAPHELNDYYIRLRTLIEMLYRYNANKKVIVVGHSMGNPVMNFFYHNYVSEKWKNKYIKGHISLAGAWGGSMQIVKLFASGYNMDYYRIILPPSGLRAMQRSFTSSALLFPSYKLWETNEILASVPSKNYTINNVNEFFNDIGYPVGNLQYNYIKDSLILDAPGVEVYCMYGTHVKTPGKFTWTKESHFPNSQPDIIEYDDGDGTVNIRSLEVCKNWNVNNNNGKKVTSYNFTNADHMSILSDKRVIEAIRSILYT